VNDERNIIQLDAGSFAFKGIQTTLTYNWLSMAKHSNFSSYYGFGVSGGFSWKDSDWYPHVWDKNEPTYLADYLGRTALYRYAFVGVVGMIGLEYGFDRIPLVISLDYRPLIGADIGKQYKPNNLPDTIVVLPIYPDKIGVKYHIAGLLQFGFSVKYLF
jgi:hypothetical protein